MTDAIDTTAQNNTGPAGPESTPPSDLSRRAISLGRYLDRLPEGDYIVVIHKQDQGWRVSVMDAQERRTMDLFR